MITYSGLHQLHIFIFVLAVFHVLYSVVTIVLAKAKVSIYFCMSFLSPNYNILIIHNSAKRKIDVEQMKKWKSWESETSSLEYQYTNGIVNYFLLLFKKKLCIYNIYYISMVFIWRSKLEGIVKIKEGGFDFDIHADPARFRFTHQTSFVKRHSGFSTTPGIRWIVRLKSHKQTKFKLQLFN